MEYTVSLLIVTKVSAGPASVRAWLKVLKRCGGVRSDTVVNIPMDLVEIENEGKPVDIRLSCKLGATGVCHLCPHRRARRFEVHPAGTLPSGHHPPRVTTVEGEDMSDQESAALGRCRRRVERRDVLERRRTDRRFHGRRLGDRLRNPECRPKRSSWASWPRAT